MICRLRFQEHYYYLHSQSVQTQSLFLEEDNDKPERHRFGRMQDTNTKKNISRESYGILWNLDTHII